MAAAPRKLISELADGFWYMKNNTRLSARYVRKPPKGIPAYDTIKLEISRTKPPGWVGRRQLWLRPDEAVAVAGVLMTAVWKAIEPGRRRKR